MRANTQALERAEESLATHVQELDRTLRKISELTTPTRPAARARYRQICDRYRFAIRVLSGRL